MRAEHSGQLAASIVEFCRFLRTHGFTVEMRKTITALDAARTMDIGDTAALKFALRAALCSNVDEWERFPAIFGEFWAESDLDPRLVPGKSKRRSQKDSENQDDSATMFSGDGQSGATEEKQKAVYGASAQQRLKKVDFSEVHSDDQAALEEISYRLLRRMCKRLSRRLAISARASRVDLRRSIRRSIAHGGDPITLAFKARKLSRNKFVLLIDISGSMNFYSLFLVRFAYALQAQFPRVQTFLFGTSLVAISDLLRGRSLKEALKRLSERAAGWSGGTRIGESLRQFEHDYGRTLTRDTVFMILSDGWETGEPNLLADQLKAVRRRAFRIIWLNPLLGLKDYQPITRGMAAALPYVDVFAPAHNLESLLTLEKHL